MNVERSLIQTRRLIVDEATCWIATPECGETSRGHIEKLIALVEALAAEAKS